jgi:hypothetical protein
LAISTVAVSTNLLGPQASSTNVIKHAANTSGPSAHVLGGAIGGSFAGALRLVMVISFIRRHRKRNNLRDHSLSFQRVCLMAMPPTAGKQHKSNVHKKIKEVQTKPSIPAQSSAFGDDSLSTNGQQDIGRTLSPLLKPSENALKYLASHPTSVNNVSLLLRDAGATSD